MKKLTSVVLSVLMVISLFGCLFTGTTVSATETGSTAPNLITNGDFESFDVNTRKPDNNENHNCVPAFAWRSIKTILGNDKTNGQWYRTTDGCKPNESPDLDSNYNDVTKSKTTYPTYFGANSQMVIEPTEAGNSTNHVLRAVQDLNAQVELENKGKYTLSFRFKLPNANTGLTSFTLSFITPDVDPKNPSAAFHTVKKPYVITNAKLESSGTDDGITIDSNNNIIQFAGSNAHEDWKNVKVTFEVNRDNSVDFPVYTDSADNNKEYTFPVLMRIQFSLGDKIDLSTQLGENSSIQKKDSFLKTCIYFDDFAMYEVVDCFGDADFYDVDGNPPTQKNAYVGIKTQVNGIETSALKLGDVVTATLEYNKDCNIFAGWYKNDGEFVQKAETLTFTVNDTDKYYPKFIDINLLRGAASFEGYDNGTTLTYADSDADTSGNFPPPTSDKWGTSTEGEYFRDNWFQVSTVKGSKDEPYYSAEATDYSTKMTVSPRSGNSMLRINTHSRSAICALEKLTPNTDYTLSFYVYDTSDKDYIKYIGIADSHDGYKPESPTSGTAGNIANISLQYDDQGWKKVNLSFNSGENATLYLFITQSASAKFAYQGASFVDDLVCYKDNLTITDLEGEDKEIAYNGTSIRAAAGDKPQALRYKFEIQDSLINDQHPLYGDLVEYGSIAIRKDYLGKKELVKDGKYTYQAKEHKPVSGVTYKKENGKVTTDKVFEKTENGKIFTAALYNIGYNTKADTTNYAAWGYDYSVRNYAIFKDENGNEKTVYGKTTAVSSVFEVMNAIETNYGQYKTTGRLPEGITAEKLENDYNTVINILGDANSEKNQAYQTWLTNNGNVPTCTVTAVTATGNTGDAGYVYKVGRSYFAKAYTGNKFLGWYADSDVYAFSEEPNLTGMETQLNGATNIYAKFENNNLLKDIAGAENLTNNDFKMYQYKDNNNLPTEENYFYCGVNSNTPWQSASITDKPDEVHSGSKAININARTQDTTCIVMQKLEKYATYKVSFWWKVNKPNGRLRNLLVAPTSVNSTRDINVNNKLGGIDGFVNKASNSDWTYTEVEFYTGDNDSVKLFYYYDTSNVPLPTDTYLYMDELTLNKVTPSAN